MITVTQQQTADSSAVTSREINYPDDIQAGDLLFAFLSFDGNPTITMPAGWTELFRDNPNNTGALYYRRATSALSGTFTVNTSASEPTAAMVYRIRGERLSFTYQWERVPSANLTEWTLPQVEQSFQPTEVLMIASIFGIYQGGLATIAEYPYSNGEYFNSGATGTAQTSHLSCHEIRQTNSETPVLKTVSSNNFLGLMSTLMIYEEDIQKIDPTFAPIGSVGSIGITAVGEIDENNILLDGQPAEEVVKFNDNQASIIYPVSNTEKTVTLRVGLNTENTPTYLDKSFFYTKPKPEIESIAPEGIAINSTETIIIKGINFRNDSVVIIDDVPCDDIVVVDEETITCTVPASAVQKIATLKVTAGDGSEVKTNFFYMEEIPPSGAKEKVKAGFTVEAVLFSQQ